MSKPPSPQPITPNPNRVNILLVDDNPANLVALRAILESTGHNLVEVQSGEEALRRLQGDEFAVVLLDVRMPGLDGFETAQRIREQSRGRRTPVIFISAHEEDARALTKAYSLGAVDYLTKPIIPEILQAKVRGFVDLYQQTQLAKRQSELFRLLVEGSKEYAIYMLDPTGHVISWNPGAERIKGYRATEIIGQHFSRFYPPEERNTSKPEQELRQAVTTGKYEEEGWRVRKDGSRLWASVVLTPLWSETGKLRGFAKITRDITEKKAAEETARRLLQEQAARTAAESSAAEARRAAVAERAQREQLRITLESIGDGVIVVDDQGHVLLMNPVAETLTGWTREDAVGQPLEAIFHIFNEFTRQPAENPVGRVLREGVVVGLANHTILIARDGTQRPIDDSAAPIKDEDGNLVGVVLVFRDVTKRRRAEQTTRFLADASATLASVVDYTSTLQKLARLAVPFFADWCAIDMLQPDGSLLHLAAAHADPAKAQLAQELYRRFPPDPQALHGIWSVIRTGKSEFIPDITDADLVANIKDPEQLRISRELGPRSYIGVPLRVRGKVRGVITFITAESNRHYDLTDRSVAEDLADRATVAIENAELYRELREANRNKDEFLAMLAHELRNPLAPISNALQILQMRGVDPVTAERARDMMGRQLHHLVRLVDDLLDVSRIMQGKIELRRAPTDIAMIVARAVETARPAIDAQGHNLDITLPPEPVRVNADLVRMAQVVANLLNNSAKYTPKGGHIDLAVEHVNSDVILRIHDTGIGIARDLLPRIFDPFVQAEHGLERGQGGLGIGLTLVARLVKMHGGSVSAFSEGLGKGSEFVVRLPVVAESSTEETAPKKQRPAETKKGPRRRILVVDDNQDAADSLALLLRLQGQEVQVAHDGPSALKLAPAYAPEVVFLDIGMPGMNGYDVARRMRQLPELEKTVLIALTGWGQDEDRQRSQEAGFNHHLVKPVEPDVITGLLASV